MCLYLSLLSLAREGARQRELQDDPRLEADPEQEEQEQEGKSFS